MKIVGHKNFPSYGILTQTIFVFLADFLNIGFVIPVIDGVSFVNPTVALGQVRCLTTTWYLSHNLYIYIFIYLFLQQLLGLMVRISVSEWGDKWEC